MRQHNHLELSQTIHEFPRRRLDVLGNFLESTVKKDISTANAEWTILAEILKRSVLRDIKFRNSLASDIDAPIRQDSLLRTGITKLLDRHFPSLKRIFDDPAINESVLKGRSDFRSTDIAPDLRFRIARDVKLLSLMSYLYESNGKIQLDENNTYTDEHISLTTSDEYKETLLRMCDTSKWEYRRELGNRAYLISVDGQQMVMKEQKTKQHPLGKKTQLPKNALEEYQNGLVYKDLGVIHQEDIRFEWEKPIGSVKVGGDYSFTLWKYEPHFSASNNAIEEYVQTHIRDKDPKYKDEYKKTLQIAKKKFRKMPIWHKHSPLLFPSFSFEDFLRVKASKIYLEGRNVMGIAQLDSGYTTGDVGNQLLRFDSEAKEFVLFSYDFEYDEQINKERQDEIRANIEFHRKDGLKKGIGNTRYLYGRPQGAIQWDVCYYAMKALDGEWPVIDDVQAQ